MTSLTQKQHIHSCLGMVSKRSMVVQPFSIFCRRDWFRYTQCNRLQTYSRTEQDSFDVSSYTHDSVYEIFQRQCYPQCQISNWLSTSFHLSRLIERQYISHSSAWCVWRSLGDTFKPHDHWYDYPECRIKNSNYNTQRTWPSDNKTAFSVLQFNQKCVWKQYYHEGCRL